ncbi:MAG: hypothetical protein JW874_09335 [Spirochaetales bacterium]|nr:hypothetical protein [Spirochaetales bacterium]
MAAMEEGGQMHIRISGKAIALLCLFVLRNAAWAGSDETIRLGAFKFLLDDVRYEYRTGEDIPDNKGDKILLVTVLSYTELRPGISLTVDDLDKKVKRFKLRLDRSTLFLLVDVHVIPPRTEVSSRTVMVKLRTGMLSRFGGGAVWAAWSRLASDGRRDQLDVIAGANRGLLGYRNENIAGSGLCGVFALSYDNSLFDSSLPADLHEISAAGEFGWFIHPDAYTGVRARFRSSVYSAVETETEGLPEDGAAVSNLIISPLLAFQLAETELLSLSMALGIDMICTKPFASALQAETKARLGSGRFFINATLFCRQAFTELPFPEKQNISGLFRSPLSFADGLADSAVLGSFECGTTLVSVQLFRIFPLQLRLFAFADLAWLSGPGLFTGDGVFAAAFGPGLRVHFTMPVFMKIDISAGWNCRGEYRINFSIYGG